MLDKKVASSPLACRELRSGKEKRPPVRLEEKEERPCPKGTCLSEGNCDGRLVWDTGQEGHIHCVHQIESIKESLHDIDILPDDRIEVFYMRYENRANIINVKIY